MSSFGKRVTELRKERLLTQKALAEELGVTKNTASAWERDVRKPDFDTVATGDNIVFNLGGVEILHKVREVEGGRLVVRGLKGNDETIVDKSMLIGHQGSTFPRLGKFFYWLEKDGVGIAIAVAVVMVLIGCVPWEKVRNKRSA